MNVDRCVLVRARDVRIRWLKIDVNRRLYIRIVALPPSVQTTTDRQSVNGPKLNTTHVETKGKHLRAFRSFFYFFLNRDI